MSTYNQMMALAAQYPAFAWLYQLFANLYLNAANAILYQYRKLSTSCTFEVDKLELIVKELFQSQNLSFYIYSKEDITEVDNFI